jgi:hypothetical protein
MPSAVSIMKKAETLPAEYRERLDAFADQLIQERSIASIKEEEVLDSFQKLQKHYHPANIGPADMSATCRG